MATRIDSWCGALDTYKQAEIYLKWIGRDPDVDWETFAKWAVDEYGLDRTPSRTCLYAWAEKPGESNDYKGGAGYRAWREWQREKLIESGKLAENLVKSCPDIDDAAIVRNIKVLFTEAANMKDFKASSSLSTSFAQVMGAALDKQKLALSERAQATKEEQLRLAREKFEAAERRLQAVQDAVDKAKGGKLDPAKVADEIDKILGRKKKV